MAVSKSQPMRPAEIDLVDAVNGLQETQGAYIIQVYAKDGVVQSVTAPDGSTLTPTMLQAAIAANRVVLADVVNEITPR